jgi:hypothetical protein
MSEENKSLVICVEKSKNSKTGSVSATYMPMSTCSPNCPFLNNGCYAEYGHTGIHIKRLEKSLKAHKRISLLRLATEEANSIRQLSGKHPMRLHIVGDCRTPKMAQVISKACSEYKEKHNQPVWTYTHSWREIPRDKWGDISVFASCETIEDCKAAMKRGYAASIVRLTPFNNPEISYMGIRMVACKELTKGIKCDKCKLCFNDKSLLDNKKVICFFAHGPGTERVKQTIINKMKEVK